MRLSIPLRLNLISLSLTTMIVVTLIMVGGWMIYKQEKLNATTRARIAANELSKYTERLLGLDLKIEEFHGFENQCYDIIKNDPLLDASALFDNYGNMLHHYNGKELKYLSDTIVKGIPSLISIHKAGTWHVILPVMVSHERIEGYAVVGVNKKAFLSAVMQPIGLQILISFIFSIVTVSLQYILFKKVIGNPISQLVQTADNIHSADPERVEVLKQYSTDDDVGRIYAALYRLMNRLVEVQNSLIKQNRELDEMVKKRTQQLEMVNGQLAGDIERRKELEEELRTMADTDFLTGLPNRLSLDVRLKNTLIKARRDGLQVALFFIDLDHFKVINDTLGHQTGDKLLIEVARRLVTVLKRSDVVARLGGDEFVVILPDLSSTRHAGIIANKIIASMKEPFLVDDKQLHIGTSIGISISPDDGMEVRSLMKNADTAMYHAKNSGRNNCQYYNQTMLHTVQNRLSMETQLRSALENKNFILHFQPILNVRTLQLVGVEALLRWCTADGTLIYPDKFIGVAEEIGLILPIGSWVLQDACRQTMEWYHEGLDVGKVSVNLSSCQLSNPELLGVVTGVLDQTHMPPEKLELEITESTLMKTDEAVAVLKEFKEMGIRMAIDDFGTGYSSFSYLKLLPVHDLKIDRSFIKNIDSSSNDSKITETIINLAHGLGLGVVAEGVERKEQLAILQRYNCDQMQGYLFSKPIPAGDLKNLMTKLKDNENKFVL